MTFIVPDDATPVVRLMPVCEHCGDPVREQRCDPVDITEPWDRMRTMVPGPTYNLPCGCIIRRDTGPRPRRGRLTITDRNPSGEHTSADTDDVVAGIDEAIEDWETLDGAHWSPDGSHEHDPEPWTRRDMGVQQGQADWGCDDVAERMRPGSTACFPWASYRYQDSGPVASPWSEDRNPDLAERLARAVIAIDQWRRRIGR